MQPASTGFQALGLLLLPNRALTRFLFVRPHIGQADSLPDQRTLFVTGLPVRVDEPALIEIFSAFGPVLSAAIHPQKTSALVVFGAAEGLQEAYKAATDRRMLEVQLDQPSQPFGLKGWVRDHQAKFPGNQTLKQQLDDRALDLERRKKEQAVAAAAAEADGWTTVTRGKGRKKSDGDAGTAGGGVAAPVALAMQAAAAAKNKPNVNFYRFQQREKRVNELEQLRKKFADDKRKVAELRAARKFRPQ